MCGLLCHRCSVLKRCSFYARSSPLKPYYLRRYLCLPQCELNLLRKNRPDLPLTLLATTPERTRARFTSHITYPYLQVPESREEKKIIITIRLHQSALNARQIHYIYVTISLDSWMRIPIALRRNTRINLLAVHNIYMSETFQYKPG